MIPSPTFTNIRDHAVNAFNTLHGRASRNSWLSKIFMQNNSLKSFLASGSTGLHGRRLHSVQCIRLDAIVGTVHRTDDFDKNFRPLKKHLRDRWVDTLLRLDTDGWQPIEVHKVGEHYYVKDGHHRVSVAKAVGMMFIDAEVWDHSSCRTPRDACVSEQKTIKRRAPVYSTNS